MANNGGVAGLFAGIGGLEIGLQKSGFHADLLCEIDPCAQRVLQRQFPDVPLHADVRKLKSLPSVEVVTAGFPCQDLSQAGAKRGIAGSQSSLVGHLMRLLGKAKRAPRWVVIENVSFMLSLDSGRAMRFLTGEFERMGYRWAYRVVDARSFDVPQRRLRVVLVASRVEDPREVLFADNVSDSSVIHSQRIQAPLVIDGVGPDRVEQVANKSYGFYWTEGRIGIGWTIDAVPPIKGGSGLGIASPPAVWVSSKNEFGMPTIADGERLQGFPAGWTAPTEEVSRSLGMRWKLIGNAVCAHMSEWIGRRLHEPGTYDAKGERDFTSGSWPVAAYGHRGRVRVVNLSVWPLHSRGKVLTQFLKEPLKPLSERAASGFLRRALLTEKIRYAPEFLNGLRAYIRQLN